MKFFIDAVRSLLLVVLIIALMLTAFQIYAFETLYPNGISLVAVQNAIDDLSISAFTTLSNETTTYNLERYLWPSSLVALTDGGNRAIYYDSDINKGTIDSATKYFAKILSEGQKEEVAAEEFSAALLSEGLLLDLGRELPLDTLTMLTSSQEGESVLARELFLTLFEGEVHLYNPSDIGTRYVFAEEGLTRTFDDFIELVSEAYDAKTVDIGIVDVEELLNPAVLATSSAPYPVIISYNPLYTDESTVATYVLEGALAPFNYNISSPRRDEGEDGSIVFVENYSSITLYPSGTLEFRASDTTRGLPLSTYVNPQSGTYTTLDLIAGAYTFLDSLLPQTTGAPMGTLRLHSAAYNEEQDSVDLYFEYCVNGISVVSDEPPVHIVYTEGYFSYVSILFKSYINSGEIYYSSNIAPYLSFAAHDGHGGRRFASFVYADDGSVTDEIIYPNFIFWDSIS